MVRSKMHEKTISWRSRSTPTVRSPTLLGTPLPFREEPETIKLLEDAARGDSSAVGRLLEQHRERLTRMVRLRLDPRARGRVGVSDVLQEAFVDALDRIEEYYAHPDVPFYVWLRFLVGQRILLVHRHHVRTKKRAITQELSLEAVTGPRASSLSIAQELVASGDSPSRVAALAELQQRLVDALESMEPTDREILVLRHVEQLSNVQVAAVLELGISTASKRYVRALRKLRGILGESGLSSISGGSE